MGVFMSRSGQVGYLQRPNMKLHENSFSEVTLFHTDRREHMTKTVSLLAIMRVPKIGLRKVWKLVEWIHLRQSKEQWRGL